MKKSTLFIGLIAVSILSLIIIQVVWLNKTIRLSEEEFSRKVTKEIVPQISFEYLRNPILIDASDDELEQVKKRVLSGERVHMNYKTGEALREATRFVIDSLFRSYGIDTQIEFGIYFYDSERFEIVSDSSFIDELTNSEFKDCLSCVTRITKFSRNELANERLSGNNEKNVEMQSRRPIYDIINDPDYKEDELKMITVYFPNRRPAIIGQVSIQLAMAIVLIIILTTCFIYLINTIKNQKQLSEIKKDFVNNLTHELKTPIASILLSTKVIKKSKTVQMADQDWNFLTLIQNEGKRLETQVDRVLQVAMLDSDNFSLSKNELSIHHVIENVTESLKAILAQKDGNITLHLNAEKDLIFGDPTHLFNVFFNLVENAIKYSSSPPEICITSHYLQEQLVVKIADKGMGISKEQQALIFDKFYRVQKGNNYQNKGFGLGLSYVKSIIDAHEASIHLNSKPGKGSTFTLTFESIRNA